MKDMGRIKLVKLEERKDARHPNNIEVGYAHTGEFMQFPVVGECFWVGYGWRTSVVQEILTFNTFKTLNSVYRIIPLED